MYILKNEKSFLIISSSHFILIQSLTWWSNLKEKRYTRKLPTCKVWSYWSIAEYHFIDDENDVDFDRELKNKEKNLSLVIGRVTSRFKIC